MDEQVKSTSQDLSIQPDQPTAPPTSQQGSKKPLIIAVGIILVLLVVAGWYLLSKKPDTKISSTPKSSISTSPKSKVNADETANWKTYTDSQNDFLLKYPSAWTQRTNLAITGMGQLDKHELATFIDQKPFGYGITIGLYNEYLNLSADDFVKNYFYEKPQDDFDRKFNERVLQSYSIKTATKNDVTMSIINGLENISGRFGQAVWIQNKKDAIFILSNSSVNKPDEDEKTFNQILSTFKFTDQTSVANQTYLLIPEWRVRIPLNSKLSKLKAAKASTTTGYSQTDQAIKILVPELDNSWDCVADQDGSKATIGSLSRTTDAVRAGPGRSNSTKKIGNYTYGDETNLGSNCTTDPRYQELAKEFEASFNLLESY